MLFCVIWVFLNGCFSMLPLSGDLHTLQVQSSYFLTVTTYLLVASSLSVMIWRMVLLGHGIKPLWYPLLSIGFCGLVYVYTLARGTTPVLLTWLSTAVLLAGAAVLGGMLSSAIKKASELVPVCLTAAAADVASVWKGPTQSMVTELTSYYSEGMRGVPPLVDAVIIKVEIPGYDMAIPLFGVTDWVLIALLSSSLLRMGHSDNLLRFTGSIGRKLFFPVSAVALLCGLIVAQIAQIFIPAMAIIAAFFLLFLLLQENVVRELGRREILYSILFPPVVVALIYLYST